MRFAVDYDCPQPAYGQLVKFSSFLPAGAARPVASRASHAQMRQLACTRGIRLALR
jgi:hypothetical protein